MIILDMGSGNTCKNDVLYVERMIDELAAVDTGKHEIVIKWQLFTECPPNEVLWLAVFDYAYEYAKKKGYQTTASVFDLDGLQFLLKYDIPFVKLANRPDLYWLAGEVPRKIPIYISVGDMDFESDYLEKHSDYWEMLCCVSAYPAAMEQYEKRFSTAYLYGGISDHTTDFTLYHKYKPVIYECHYKLPDSTGPDSGEFARTPEALREVL